MSPWWLKPTGEAAEDGAKNEKELPAKESVEPAKSKPKKDAPARPRRKSSKSAEDADKESAATKSGAADKASDASDVPVEPKKPARRSPRKAAAKKAPAAAPVPAPAPEPEKEAGPPTILDTLLEPEPLVIPQMPKPVPSEDGDADGDGDDDSKDRPGRSRSRRSRGRGGSRRSQSGDSDTDGRKGKSSTRRGGRKKKGDSREPLPVVSAFEMSPDPGYGLGSRMEGRPDEARIALFCDLENVALGVRDSEIKKFEIGLVLERLLEKGRIIIKKAYSDWERYSEYKRPFHEAAIELIDIPQKHYSGKNSADIKMVVDAMDLCYAKEHLDTFVILSGDSDFSPLVSKLREANKQVIGVGVKNSSSQLLISNCDEFIFYEDVWRDAQRAPSVSGADMKNADAFKLMVSAIKALMRENKDVLWGSMVKQTMQRKQPSFSEGYYGYSTFSELLEDAQKNNLVELERDRRSGSYIVLGFGK